MAPQSSGLDLELTKVREAKAVKEEFSLGMEYL
jgi:hypothetical protein